MDDLASILSARVPKFQTHQALVVIGLQEDLISPEGKIPVPTDSGFVDRIKYIIPRFRDGAGDVIWIQTVCPRPGEETSKECDLHQAAMSNLLLDVRPSPAGSTSSLGVLGEEQADDLESPVSEASSTGSGSAPGLRQKGSRSTMKGLLKKMGSRKTLSRQEKASTASSSAKQPTDSSKSSAVPALPPVDPEAYLSRKSPGGPAFVSGTLGAEFELSIKERINTTSDIIVQKPRYSAFDGTSLLNKLRGRFITELYLVGCMTNISVYATACDAARHGLRLNLIEDCLGYRTKERHQEALRQMTDLMGARLLNSTEILDDLSRPTDAEAAREKDAKEIEGLLGGMQVKGDSSSSARSLQIPSSSSDYRAPSSSSAIHQAEQPSVTAFAPLSRHPYAVPTSSDAARALASIKAKAAAARDSGSMGSSAGTAANTMRSQPANSSVEVDLDEDQVSDDEDLDDVLNPANFRRPERTLRSTSQPQRTTSAPSEQRSASAASGATTGTQRSSASAPQNEAEAAKSRYVATKVRMRHRTRPKEGEASGPAAVSSRSPAASPENVATLKSQDSLTQASPSPMLEAGVVPPPETSMPDEGDTTFIKTSSDKEVLSEDEIRARQALALLEALQNDVGKHENILQLVDMVHDYRQRTLEGAEAGRQGAINVLAETNIEAAAIADNPPSRSMELERAKEAARTYGSGDSYLLQDLMPASLTYFGAPLSDHLFAWLYSEVHWQTMYHQTGSVPRLVCAQGAFGMDVGHTDGRMPVYRHPSDTSLALLHFTPAVQMIREEVIKRVGHEVNHCLIQLYRSGNDYISEHSDKTLDIVRGSSIVNVSFGAMRTMRLRTKRAARDMGGSASKEEAGSDAASTVSAATSTKGTDRETQRIPLPHNSLFVLGQDSNMRYLHGINADKRRTAERSDAEMAHDGMRISLTFRHIGTFLSADSSRIWGQGATVKRYPGSKTVNGIEEETEKLVRAFGRENQATELEWEGTYGRGFDVLHFRGNLRERRMLFLGDSEVENQGVKSMLEELGWGEEEVEIVVPPPKLDEAGGEERRICLRDVDANHTEVRGAREIFLYLNRYR